MKLTKSMYENQTIESRELYLYCDNNYELYKYSISQVLASLKRKYKKGVFDRQKAIEAFYHVATRGSELYFKDFGYKFNVNQRWNAAIELLNSYIEEIEED